ncbi:uncharacterized protein LOC117063929 [Trachypithecus francoisi]|uniref:uncharacterized protein LOC117063929 n=1 Tax=Trachypithecus francoisi TaxID=54180 RepID=UPI00141AF512|nr:uncharacterized protein LOC117063929 [Trachypithecus francoisi]
MFVLRARTFQEADEQVQKHRKIRHIQNTVHQRGRKANSRMELCPCPLSQVSRAAAEARCAQSRGRSHKDVDRPRHPQLAEARERRHHCIFRRRTARLRSRNKRPRSRGRALSQAWLQRSHRPQSPVWEEGAGRHFNLFFLHRRAQLCPEPQPWADRGSSQPGASQSPPATPMPTAAKHRPNGCLTHYLHTLGIWGMKNHVQPVRSLHYFKVNSWETAGELPLLTL